MANVLDSATTARILYGTDLLSFLRKNLFMAQTVSRKYTQTGGRLFGTVRVPNVTIPGVTKRSKHTSVTWGDATANYVDVVLDTHAIVPMTIDSLDVVISDIDFRRQMAERGAIELAEQIESDLWALHFAVPNFVGAAASAIFATDAKIITAANKILDDEKVPLSPRFGALNPFGKESALDLPTWTQYNTAGNPGVQDLITGGLGPRYGVNWGMTQGIGSRTGGGTQWAGTVLTDLAAPLAVGATVLHIDGLTSATAALKKGDAFKVGNYYYSLAADATAASNEVDLVLAQPLREAIADGAAITTGEGVKTAVVDLIYHPEAFALATAPMNDARPGTQTSVIVDDQTGLAVTVTYSFDHADFAHRFSTEILYGVKTVRPEMAVRLLSST